MVDYSRFDHIGSDSEDDDTSGVAAINVPTSSSAATPTTPASIPPPGAAQQQSSPADQELARMQQLPQQVPGGGGGSAFPQPMMMTASKKGKEGRTAFEHEGRTVYEWEQSLEEVNLYIETPPGLQANSIDCTITPKHLRLGIKGNPPFIDEDTGGPVVVEESYWMMDGGELNVNLQKMRKADTWPAALGGKNTTVDPVTLEGMQKKIMLERFQAENPGFDFSGAEFNGQVPDARTFMGGVKYA